MRLNPLGSMRGELGFRNRFVRMHCIIKLSRWLHRKQGGGRVPASKGQQKKSLNRPFIPPSAILIRGLSRQNVLQLQSLGALLATALLGASSPLPPPMRCAPVPAPETGEVGVAVDPVSPPSSSPSSSFLGPRAQQAAFQWPYRSQQCLHARDGLPSG